MTQEQALQTVITLAIAASEGTKFTIRDQKALTDAIMIFDPNFFGKKEEKKEEVEAEVKATPVEVELV